jgi:hypothetical protein
MYEITYSKELEQVCGEVAQRIEDKLKRSPSESFEHELSILKILGMSDYELKTSFAKPSDVFSDFPLYDSLSESFIRQLLSDAKIPFYIDFNLRIESSENGIRRNLIRIIIIEMIKSIYSVATHEQLDKFDFDVIDYFDKYSFYLTTDDFELKRNNILGLLANKLGGFYGVSEDYEDCGYHNMLFTIPKKLSIDVEQ